MLSNSSAACHVVETDNVNGPEGVGRRGFGVCAAMFAVGTSEFSLKLPYGIIKQSSDERARASNCIYPKCFFFKYI